MKKNDLFILKLNLQNQNFFDFRKGSYDKKRFLLNKISQIARAWKYPVFDHKHKAIDIMNNLKGKNKSYFMHISSVAKQLICKYCAFKFALLKDYFAVGELDDILEKFPFFDFDGGQFRVSAVAFSYVFNSFTKSYYVVLDFGLKHFLRVPLANFVKLSNRKSLCYDLNYLFINSLHSYDLFNSCLNVNFDYFLYFSNCKYSDKALYCFFYVNFFFRKLRSNFFNLDFFVSTQFEDDFSHNASLSHASMPAGSAFSCDYWHSRYLNPKYMDFFFFKTFLKKIYDFSKADIFLNFFNEDTSDNRVFFERLGKLFFFKIINGFSNSICNYLYKSFYSGCIFFENIFKNFIIMVFKRIGFVSINKFKSFKFWIEKYTHCNLFFYQCFVFIKVFYSLFFLYYYLYNFQLGEERNSFFKSKRKKFCFLLNSSEFMEDLDVFLRRKRRCAKWQDNLLIRKYGFVMGVNGFFFFPLLIKDWKLMNTYHKRMVSFKIFTFVNSVSSLFFFFFKKNYLSLFCKLNDRIFFETLCNARLFLNFFCFLRHLGYFDKSLNEDVKDWFFKQIVGWKEYEGSVFK